jgi:hypothetical protein
MTTLFAPNEGENIIGTPDSWQGDPLRCSACGQLIERHTRKVPEEKIINIPSVGCQCERRPTLVHQKI